MRKMVMYKWLDSAKLDGLKKEIERFELLSSFLINNSELVYDDHKRAVLPVGSLTYCQSFGNQGYHNIEFIADNGIMASEFWGVAGKKGQYYHANFYEVLFEITLEKYLEEIGRVKDLSSMRSNYQKNLIIFVINPAIIVTNRNSHDDSSSISSAIRELATLKNNSLNKSIFINNVSIPIGIPAVFISGIIVGDGVFMDNDKMKFLQERFPHSYITSQKGDIYSKALKRKLKTN